MLPETEVAEPTSVLFNNGFDAGDVSAHPVGWSVVGSDASAIYQAADKTAGPGSLELATPPARAST
jgi:hypothetical protein